jgi:hydroxymethylbilane synthase
MTAAMPLRVGTRGSPLALIQTRAFIARFRMACVDCVEEHVIRTTGDAVQDRRLAEIGGKGLFAKEIHEALAQGRIDLAVHSLKDLETALPPGIMLGCTLEREDARDALILADPKASTEPTNPFACLPAGAVVGTSSVRRQAQLLHARPDIGITALRGSVQTRLNKLTDGACDASLLALAGLKRLGLADRASAVLDPETMVPAAGQGIIGVTVREDDGRLRDLLAAVDDAEARAAATAERAVLQRLDGSCRTPIGAYARILPNGMLHLTGLVARPDGSFVLKRSLQGAVVDADRIGREIGDNLRADSPRDIFD